MASSTSAPAAAAPGTLPYIDPPGTAVADLQTPCLVVELDAFERNTATMASICRDAGKQWRPHSKANKSPVVARRMLDAGAIGVTCAKLGEAEVMAAAGIQDLLIANPLVGAKRLARLVALRASADPVIVVDHHDHVAATSAAAAAGGVEIRTIIEVDIGLGRVGTQPGAPTLELAKAIDAAPGLVLSGIMGYEGHLLGVEDPGDKRRQIAAAMAVLGECQSEFVAAGLDCTIVSAGGTGSFRYTVESPAVTEIQAGGGVLMDRAYRDGMAVDFLDYALFVHATVTSRPTADRVITDAGRKTMHPDMSVPLVWGRDDLEIKGLSAEHGSLRVLHGAGPAIGERIVFVPGYSDGTTVLHDQFYAVRDGVVEEVWPLEGRGRLA